MSLSPPAEPTAPPPPLVWVVDDSPTEIEIIRHALAPICRTEVFTSGEVMLEAILHCGLPDVLVLDWQMPGMSGIEVCRYLRGNPTTLALPILLLTVNVRIEEIAEGLMAGANDYVLKPFHPLELAARVNALFRWELVRRRTLADERARRVLAESSLAEVQAAEARASRSEQRYQLAARATRDVIWEWDVRTGLLDWSVGLQTHFGYPLEDSTRHIQWLAERIHAEERERVMSGFHAALASTAEAWEDEFRLRRADGSWAHVVNRAHIVRDERGQASQVVGALQDVTLRKRLEAEARQNAAFERQLIGIVSHDLRNPLHAITLGAAALLKSEELDDRLRRTAVRILTSAERATRMIRDLLDLTQARQGGGIPLQRRAADLHELVDAVVEEIQPVHPDRTLEVEQSGDASGEWDPDRLAQVITNLMSNALQYSPPGTPVRVVTRGVVDRVTLEVHNAGEPIRAELLTRLFEPMERGTPHPVGRAVRSIGLGLYIVRSIIIAHGGTVDVRSTAEEGTTFTVHLPRAPIRGSGPGVG